MTNPASGRVIRVVDLTDPTSYTKGWWAAQCTGCKTWLTKYDHSADEARAFAESAPCKCEVSQGVLV